MSLSLFPSLPLCVSLSLSVFVSPPQFSDHREKEDEESQFVICCGIMIGQSSTTHQILLHRKVVGNKAPHQVE